MSYIGQTRQSVESRWKQHLYKTKANVDNCYFHNAIKKYGKENFTIEVLEECDIEKLDSREIYYIAKYNTFKNGYNLTIGGGGKRVPDVYNKYEEIKDLYLSGFSSNWIADKFGVDKSTIVKILKGLDIKIRYREFKVNRFELNAIIEEYNNGCSLKELARRYDCCSHTIKKKLVDNGVEIRERFCDINQEEDKQKRNIE